VLLFIWVVPKIFNYYQNSKNYDNKKNELKEMYSRYNILDKAEKFSLKAFKKDAESIFSDVRVEEKEDNEYVVVLQIEKNRIKEINSFIETLSLHYLVQIKDSELKFEDKNQMIELKFILEEL